MEATPLVSILIAAYNAENYLAETLDSVLAQSYPNIEVIVVDDGSADGTAAILNSYSSKGIHVYYQPNRGQGAALNYAFSLSKGNLIKFMDADDLLSPQNIALQVQRLAGTTEHIASSEWARFYKDDIRTALFRPEEVWCDLSPIDWLIKSIKKGANMMQCAIFLIPRGVLLKSGLWNEKLTLIIDFEFFTRVILHSAGVRFTEGAKLYYRSGIVNSVSGRKSRTAMESALLATQLVTEYILATENSPRAKRVCSDAFQLLNFTMYPEYPDLAIKAESQAIILGGSAMPVPGGRVLQFISSLMGWKRAKKIQGTMYKLGYLKLRKNAHSNYH